MHSLQQLKYCKNGQTNEKPQYKYKTCKKTFQTQHKNNKTKPQTKQQTLKTTNNNNDTQNTTHALNTNTNTTTTALKKTKKPLVNLNPKYTNLTSPLKTRLETDEK
jgi:transposase-like protein